MTQDYKEQIEKILNEAFIELPLKEYVNLLKNIYYMVSFWINTIDPVLKPQE